MRREQYKTLLLEWIDDYSDALMCKPRSTLSHPCLIGIIKILNKIWSLTQYSYYAK